MPPDETAATISPITGWTRRDWERLADQMLLALRPFASPNRAQFNLPGPASQSGVASDGLEGFARSFLLAAFRLAGAGGDDPHDFASWYAAGIEAGTDPASPDRWPWMRDTGQAKVEAASIVVALHETRPLIWDRLDDATRQRTVAWLSEIIGSDVPENNWVWFRAIVNAFLASIGAPSSDEDIERAIALTDDWYAGDGWYSDGVPTPGQRVNFDFYNAWAMHVYPLWLGRMLGERWADVARRARQRLHRYLEDAPYLIAANGAPIFQGRSLTYRFAVTIPLWLGALFDCSPLALGLTRRAASGAVSYFVDHGALGDDGVLPIGWHGAFVPMRQMYSGPGSPYWASKAFAGLLLAPDHPVWQATEEPLPVERGDTARTIRPAGWLVNGTQADGIVRLVNHGAPHAAADALVADVPHYAGIAFSSHAAPDYPPPDDGPRGSQVTLIDAVGRRSHRTAWRLLEVRDGVAISRHRAHWMDGDRPIPGPLMMVASVCQGAWEVRAVRVDEDREDAPQASLILRMDAYTIAAPNLTSVVQDGFGLPETGEDRREGSNPMGTMSVTPWIASDGPVRPGRLYAGLVCLTQADPGPPPELELDGNRLTVRWPGGTVETVAVPAADDSELEP